MKRIVIITVFCILLVILLSITIFGQRGLLHMRGLQNELLDFRNQNAHLHQENSKLRIEIKLLEKNIKYLETLARKDLGLIKNDEIVYHLEKKQPSTRTGK